MGMKKIRKGNVNISKRQITAIWDRQLRRSVLPDDLVMPKEEQHQGSPKAYAGTGGFKVTRKDKHK